MAETVSDVLVSCLLDWGVDTVFGLPGDGINDFMEALRKAKDRIRYVHTRHEEAAAMAACGYAKFSGKLGVCFATSGPGAVHLLNGLYDAKIDQAPVRAITAMTYHDLIGTHYLQDMNQDYLFQDVAMFNQRVMGPAHLENLVDLGCRVALSHRAVAYVCIPIDVQTMPAKAERRFKRNVPGHTSDVFTPPRRVPERALLERAAAALRDRHKIAILVGAGARGAGAEVEQLAEKLAAPVVKALLGNDVMPDDSSYCVGGTGFVGTRPSSNVLEPPEPPKTTRDEAKKLAESLARGTPIASRIGLSIGRSMLAESTYAASPFGVPARALGVTHAAAEHDGPAGAILSKLPPPSPKKKRRAALVAVGSTTAGAALFAAYFVERR
jgi:pyruvate dehydrogenase (quinone)